MRPSLDAPAAAPTAPVRYDGRTHFYGVGSVVLAGIGVPALLTLANKGDLDSADRWILRGVAYATTIVVLPLGAMYLIGLAKQRGA
jgi:hypothetical protein